MSNEKPVAATKSWPVGAHLITNDQLAGHMSRSAQEYARQAIKLHGETAHLDKLTCVIYAGSAVELLAKSILASVNVALIVEKTNLDGMLHALGRSDLASNPALATKTITVSECLHNLGIMFRQFQWNGRKDTGSQVLDARNAAIHLGLVDGPSLHGVIQAFVKLVDRLLDLTDTDKKKFWSAELEEVVAGILDQSAQAIRSTVAIKIVQARARYQNLLGKLDSESEELVLQTIAATGLRLQFDHSERRECPACENEGWLGYDIERGRVQSEYHYSEPEPIYFVTQTAYPSMFFCPICELEFDYEEIETRGDMADGKELEAVEPTDYEFALLEYDPSD